MLQPVWHIGSEGLRIHTQQKGMTFSLLDSTAFRMLSPRAMAVVTVLALCRLRQAARAGHVGPVVQVGTNIQPHSTGVSPAFKVEIVSNTF